MELIGIQAIQQSEEAFAPRGFWCNALQQVTQNGENAEHVVRSHVKGLVPLRIFRLLWDDWLGANAPVPEAAMVGTDVAHCVYGDKPRFEHMRAHI